MWKKLPKLLQNISIQAVAMRIAAAILLCTATTYGLSTAAYAATKSYGLTSFDSVELQAPYQVSITLGSSINGRAEGSQAALDVVEMTVIDNRLVIRERRDGATQVRRDSKGVVRIFIQASAALKSVNVRGAGTIAISGMNGTNLALSVNGAGQIAADKVQADVLQMMMQGSGGMTVAGKVRSLKSNLEGSGATNAAALQVRQLELRQNGAGNSMFLVSELSTIWASGPGIIDIQGKGFCRIQQDGGSNIQCTGKILPKKGK